MSAKLSFIGQIDFIENRISDAVMRLGFTNADYGQLMPRHPIKA